MFYAERGREGVGISPQGSQPGEGLRAPQGLLREYFPRCDAREAKAHKLKEMQDVCSWKKDCSFEKFISNRRKEMGSGS